MRKTKHWLMTIAALLCSLAVSAEKVEINGIWYNLNTGDKQAEVTFKGFTDSHYKNEYSGDIAIPATVIYDGVEYSVTSIHSQTFSDCSSLATITLPEGVTSIGDFAFDGCTGLTSITIPESSQLTSIGNYAFYECTGLTSITIPEGVTSIGDRAFYGCTGLTAITIPESSQLISIGNSAFYGCTGLTSITIPEGVTSIGEWAFYGCKRLNSVSILGGLSTIHEDAFEGCENITYVNVVDIAAWCSINFSNYEANPLYYARDLHLNGELITELIIPEGVTSIGWYAFYGCNSLTAITIPASVTKIGGYAFTLCENLISVSIPEISDLTIIGSSAFYLCRKLTYITIPEGVTRIGDYALGETNLSNITIPEGVISIGSRAFYNCKSLASVVIPKSVTSIGTFAFNGCSSLASIIIPKESKLTTIGNDAFSGCSFTSFDIPNGVTSIGNYAFYGCSNLTSIIIPECVTNIGNYAFEKCKNLISVDFSKSSRIKSIGNSTFSGCSSLTAINIPDSVTSIGSYAFYGCSSLTDITLPKSVTSIGSYAFDGCSSLTDVYCYAEEVPTTETNAFYDSNIENATLHVPANALNAYKTTAPWSSFGKFEILTPRSVTITINQYGSGTYSSEYALDFSQVEGLKAYAATGFNTETGIVTLTRVMTSKPGMGLFVKGEPGEYIVPTLEKTSDNSLNMLVGTLAKTGVNKTSDDGLYRNFRYTTKTGVPTPMFYEIADGYTLSANRAYLQIPTAWLPAETKSIALRFDEGEGTTDIDASTLNPQRSTEVYDLYGRRIAQPVKGAMYIVNGRKVVY